MSLGVPPYRFTDPYIVSVPKIEEEHQLTVKPTLAVLFDNVGPYHVARLEALCRYAHVIAIERCRNSAEYAWHKQPHHSFELLTLEASAPGTERTKSLEGILSGIRPDAILVPGWSSAFALRALAWARLQGIAAILMSDTHSRSTGTSYWRNLVKRVAVRCFSAALVAGSPQADYAIALGMPPERVRIGYDVVDNAHFASGARVARDTAAELRDRLRVPDRYFLAITRFLPRKNLLWLIDEFQSYRERVGHLRAARLMVVGGGEMREEILARIQRYGLADQVRIAEFQGYNTIPQLLGLSTALILPSLTETWGLVVNEAMAASVPVIVSRECGCVTDLVTEGQTGLTFDPTSSGALCDALVRFEALGDNERAALVMAADERISRFSPDFFARSVMELVGLAKPEAPAAVSAAFFRCLSAYRELREDRCA